MNLPVIRQFEVSALWVGASAPTLTSNCQWLQPLKLLPSTLLTLLNPARRHTMHGVKQESPARGAFAVSMLADPFWRRRL